MKLSNLYIGACSWKYPEWSMYPKNIDAKKFNYLKTYAEQYNTVEIDQWFWSLYAPTKVRMPTPRDAHMYADSVPDTFRFTIKAPNAVTLTHFYSSGSQAHQYPEYAGTQNPHFLNLDLLDSFLRSIHPMKDKLGMIMFEFEYLNKQKMSGVQEFIAALDPFLAGLPKGYSFGVEIRNPNYLTKSFQDVLRKHRTSFVLLHGYYMPPAWETAMRIDLTAPKSIVMRLLGPDRSGIEKITGSRWDKIAIDRTEEIEKIGRIIQTVLASERTVYVNINNHFEGCAPLTIERLKKFLRE